MKSSNKMNFNYCMFTYRQWFGNTNPNSAIAGGLQNVYSIIQAGAFQVSFINKHESVTRQQATILICYTSRHQGPDYQNCFRGILWILKSNIQVGRIV